MTWKKVLNVCVTSLVVTTIFSAIQMEAYPLVGPLIAPLAAYPSFSNPPIRPYDSAALLAIVRLINPPHLKLTRVPARYFNNNYRRSPAIPPSMIRQFKELPLFDTPIFEYFQDVKQNESTETNHNSITITTMTPPENWSSRIAKTEHPLPRNENLTPETSATTTTTTTTTTTENNNLQIPIHNTTRDLYVNQVLLKTTRKFETLVIPEPLRLKVSPVLNTKETTENIFAPFERIPRQMEETSLKPPGDYSFKYSVADHDQGDVKSHTESRKGGIVTGEYTLLEPDGYTRVVSYYSDGKSGFKARVIRIAPLKANHI